MIKTFVGFINGMQYQSNIFTSQWAVKNESQKDSAKVKCTWKFLNGLIDKFTIE